MFTIYVYTMDTMADWELGYVTAELNSGRFFRKDAPHVSVKTVGISKEPVKTMGGLRIFPDCVVEDILVDDKSVLLLPGANTWSEAKHSCIIKKATELLSIGATVCAICGATVALANAGLLDKAPHASNGAEYLEMFCANYKGKEYYVDEPCVVGNNIITAGAAGALLWAKHIIQQLDVFSADTLEEWFLYFSTGEEKHFFALMETLPT